LLLFIAAFDYLISQRVARSSRPLFWVLASVSASVSILVIFKYLGFFSEILDDVIRMTGWGSPIIASSVPRLVLPLGISFFVFETLAYIIDVYRGAVKPARRLSDYAMYLAFFPHLIAGPLYRYSEVADYIERPRRMQANAMLTGLFLFVMGLGMKVIVANPMGELADTVFGHAVLGTLEAWLGALAYSIQIYFDFAGYSVMAIGLGRMLMIPLPQNFNQPYTATSVTDFWRRWHMSLSRWLRDYLYIPLGGSHRGSWRTYRNLVIVFVVCGLWHGANFTFLVWGLMHGAALVFERVKRQFCPFELPDGIARPVCFVFVMVTWVMFRSDSVTRAIDFYQAMFHIGSGPLEWQSLTMVLETRRVLLALAIGLCSVVSFKQIKDRFHGDNDMVLSKAVLIVTLGLVAVGTLVAESFNPFIYYRF
jgi:alginate O-acetyltransferase complex protein AlgI